LTTLAPQKPLKFKPEKGSDKSLFTSKTQAERAINKIKPLFALLMVESNTCGEMKPMHPLDQLLLREFVDAFLNDLPPVLSPLRGIEH